MKLKVFLVEDESVIREGLRNNILWEQYGYQFVGEAADGEMALPLIRKTQPDVLITDIKMPFMDGLSLSKIVSAEFPKMKIIIISGYDDFEYARQAIEVGVEQYLLKPITRMTLKKVLLDLKEKIEQDLEQQDYQQQFQNEMQEYEQFARRHFFERILEGELSVKDIYDEAAKQAIEIAAPCYNLLFFYMQEKNSQLSEKEMNELTRRQNEILHYFLRHPQYIVFGWHVNCYGVFIKGEKEQIDELVKNGVAVIQKNCEQEQLHISWYVAIGNPVERLSMISECYQGLNHCLAYRFIVPNQHILSQSTLANYLNNQEEKNIEGVDSAKMNPNIIRDFLEKGSKGEIHDFVDNYLQGIREALNSNMFRDYIVLSIRFTVTAYIEQLGVSQDSYKSNLDALTQDMHIKPNDVFDYFVNMLYAALEIREQESDFQSKKMIHKALDYIEQHYDQEDISLNQVAGEINVSANYFSAIFSQTMQKTFVEYVTAKRMEKAKKLLKGTEKSSGEIAVAVGYKDPHYFSFVFRKTQGCSPREYRTNKKASKGFLV